MSLSIYSAQSSEANRLKFGEFEIYYDQEQDKVIIKTGKDQVYFDTLYNKEQVDQLISQGVDPTSFENWLFNRTMIYSFATGASVGIVTLKELFDYLNRDMLALNILLNRKVDSSDIVSFSSGNPPTVNQIYYASSIYNLLIKVLTTDNTIQWDQNTRPGNNKIYYAGGLYDLLIKVLTTDNTVQWDQNTKPGNDKIYYADGLYDLLIKVLTTQNTVQWDQNTKPGNDKIYTASSLYDLLIKVLTTDNTVQWNQDTKPENETQIYSARSLYDYLKQVLKRDDVVDFDFDSEPAENQIYSSSSTYEILRDALRKQDLIPWKKEERPESDKVVYNAPSLYDYLKDCLTKSNLVEWKEDTPPENETDVFSAPGLWTKIKNIRECKCNPEIMQEISQIMERLYYIPNSDLDGLPTLEFFGNLHLEGGYIRSHNSIEHSLYKYRPADSDSSNVYEESYIDYETDYAPFDPENPIYGKYFMPCHVQINGTINGIHTDDILTKDDIDNLGASHFKFIDGAPPFKITNETITFETNDTQTYLYINLSDDVINYLKTVEDSISVIKVEFIKTHIYDSDGNLMQSVTLDNTGYNPMRYKCIKLKKRDGGGLSVEYFEANNLCIQTDKEETGYYIRQLYSEGQITLQYILKQAEIKSDNNIVECDIIKAKNAFTLRETDQLYLYEPAVIADKTVNEVDYWYQLYKIDANTNIIDNQIFELTDYYLGFTFSLNWSAADNKWAGYNSIQAVKEDTDRYSTNITVQNDYFAIYLEHSETNRLWLDDIYKYDLSGNWLEVLNNNNHLLWYYHKSGKDRIAIDSSDIVVKSTETKSINGGTYSYMNFTIPDLINFDGFSTKNHVGDLIECDIIMDSGTTSCSWSISASYDTDNLYSGSPDINMIHVLEFNKGVEIENTTGNTKDIELFIRKDINILNPNFPLSPSDNIFTAINAKKYYQIKPFPESCSTLYTDMCIKSSKVITADNITTMAADLNYVQNFTYDLEEEIKQVDQKCNYALEEIEDLKGTTSALSQVDNVLTIMSSVSLAIEGVVGVVGLAMNGKNIWNTVRAAFIRRRGYAPITTNTLETNILGTEPETGPYDDTPSNILPENSHIAGNIFMKFMNNIRARLRCKILAKNSTDELYKDLGTPYFNTDSHQPVYMIGTDDDYFKQSLYSSSDYFCYSDADNYDLYESVMSGETVLYLLHILQGETVDMGNRIIKYTDKFMLNSDMIQVDDETSTLTLNKLMIQNLSDEQLLIKNDDKSVLFYLSKATFDNPVAIHDTLTVTSIVCDNMKNSSDKKYITEDDIDVDIIKDIIKVLADNQIQITCTQLHCDLITNTAFEPYALEKNHYTKTEADERFALKNELTAPDLSDYYTKTEADEKYALKSEQYLIDNGSYLKSSKAIEIDSAQIDSYNYEIFKMNYTGENKEYVVFKYVISEGDVHFVLKNETWNDTWLDCYSNKVKVPKLQNLSGTDYALITDIPDLSKYALKTEIPEIDLSTCVKTTGNQTITCDNIEPALILDNTTMMPGFEGPVFKCKSPIDYLEIYSASGSWYIRNQNDCGLIFSGYDVYLRRKSGSNTDEDKLVIQEDLSKYALKTEIPEVDLSNYYIKTECDQKFVPFSSDGDLNINADISMSLTAANSVTVTSQDGIYLNDEYGVRVNIPEKIYDVRTESYYVTENDLTSYYTKTEADDKYALKTEIPFNTSDDMIEPLNILSFTSDKFSLSSTFIKLPSFGVNSYSWVIRDNSIGGSDGILEIANIDYNNNTVNNVGVHMKFIDYNGHVIIPNLYKSEEDNIKYVTNEDVYTKTEADQKYVTKTELTQYATAKNELDDYVATETLEDVVAQINTKFDSQKRRWTYKLTMNANTQTVSVNLNENISQYNPVLSNSDGKHVFVYQETNEGFEMIVLTVTLSNLSLDVQADKQSKNNYDIYLSFDEL